MTLVFGAGSTAGGRKSVWLPGATLALAALGALAGCKDQNRFQPPPPAKVEFVHPVEQKVTRYIEVTGNATPYNSVDLVARVSGFLQEINYTDGAEVTKGTNLFVVEPLPYQTKLQQTQGALVVAQAELTNAQSELVRQETLRRQDVNAQRNYDDALARRDSDQGNLTQAQANVQTAGINYTYTRVDAPFDGFVTAHLKSVGEYVGQDSATKLATIVQLAPIYVNFNISELDVQRVRALLRAEGKTLKDLGVIPVEVGLQTEGGYPHVGKLDYVAPQVDQSTGTLAARGIFTNEPHDLLPGYFVRVRVPVERDVPSLLVPDVAIGADQAGRYVLTVNASNVVEQRHVELGPLDGQLRVVTKGLTTEDRVVAGGIQRAIPGATVNPQPAATSAAPQ